MNPPHQGYSKTLNIGGREPEDYCRETWLQILHCLRNMRWQKVHTHLQQLETQENRVLGSSPAIIIWSAGGLIHHANDAFCKLVGYSLEELRVQGNGVSDRLMAHALFHPEEIVSILKKQLEAAQHPHRSAYHLKTRLVSKQNLEIPVIASVTNLRDSLGLSLLTIAHFALARPVA